MGSKGRSASLRAPEPKRYPSVQGGFGCFVVAFSCTGDAKRECAAYHKRTGRLVKRLTVQEILDEEHVQKM